VNVLKEATEVLNHKTPLVLCLAVKFGSRHDATPHISSPDREVWPDVAQVKENFRILLKPKTTLNLGRSL
jgi:hypothetical protein